ncbi:MAG TPA: hypothetical protein VFX96_12995 [Pyrinomonadaceae bacterium]|nr:hypothetical protein [Pyrinomonadaceae bacterium]
MGEEFSRDEELASGALAPVERALFMPALSVELAVERYGAITEFVGRVLRRDVDYGVIPGTEKLTLLKPGAEKLTTFFGLSTRFQLIERIEDWTGAQHDGEPFFYYLYRCQLSRGDTLIAEADGSCNSRETKYRWRESQRACPVCEQPAIIKGREEYGGGWLCFRKKGGCGAKYSDGDEAIEGQPTGRVFNPDIADQVNTIQKMATKRSLIAAVLIAVNASEYFTQDIEDFRALETTPAHPVASDVTPTTQHPQQSQQQHTQQQNSQTQQRPPSRQQQQSQQQQGPSHAPARARPSVAASADDLDAQIRAACRALGKSEAQLVEWLRKKYGAESVESLTAPDKRDVLDFLKGVVARREAA